MNKTIALALFTVGLLVLAPVSSLAQNEFIKTFSSPPAPDGGTTFGGGTYQVGTQAQLVASDTNNPCWMFTNWVDNTGNVVSSNPYIFTVTSGITNFTAVFVPATANSCQISTGVTPAGSGTTTGDTTTNCGARVVLTATNYPCYVFTNWSDESTENPHTVTASGDATYTANFVQKSYQINTVSSPAGFNNTTSGDGQYLCGTNVVLTANPRPCWVFTNWNDGNMENPRTVTVSGDATYTANFVPRQYAIMTKVVPPGSGTTTGDTTTNCGDIVTVTAQPNAGYKFLYWTERLWIFGSSPPLFTINCLSTSAKYSFVASGFKELTANFVDTNINPKHPGTCPIFPAGNHIKEAGGGGTVRVYAGFNCDWTYDHVPGHIHILGHTHTNLTYAVDALPPAFQAGGPQNQSPTVHVPFSLQIAGQTFTVLQDQETGEQTPNSPPTPPNP